MTLLPAARRLTPRARQRKLAAAQIQRLAIDNARLRATLEDQDHTKIVRLASRPTSGGARHLTRPRCRNLPPVTAARRFPRRTGNR